MPRIPARPASDLNLLQNELQHAATVVHRRGLCSNFPVHLFDAAPASRPNLRYQPRSLSSMQDSSRLDFPGFRDRIARVLQTKDEGRLYPYMEGPRDEPARRPWPRRGARHPAQSLVGYAGGPGRGSLRGGEFWQCEFRRCVRVCRVLPGALRPARGSRRWIRLMDRTLAYRNLACPHACPGRSDGTQKVEAAGGVGLRRKDRHGCPDHCVRAHLSG